MLHAKTVFPETLELLKKIMGIPELCSFNLAGGTALALQYGHRISVDLDFFGPNPIRKDGLIDLLRPLGEIKLLTQSKNILIFMIGGVKVDFVSYSYPRISDVVHIENVRMYGLPDIAAMKLSAIAGRGRKRDFVDLYFLLKKFTLSDLMCYYLEKFKDGSEMLIVKSLLYFEDADLDPEPKYLLPVKWEQVKA
ncbi:MAG: nucleotidyl transferase AbiEii/AbiGii toxin family protein, partial [Bacteroidetes bacterium]|nr:nucleotidyl transferase AbiEii/AbiGii toxin family protein [Bacteroidota bacterium]